jgi:mono/diheme cytochrome c family protein
MRSCSMALIAGCMAWCTVAVGAQTRGGNPQAAALKNPVPATARSIDDGRKLYQTHCRHCHGAKGLGDGSLAPKNPSPANLTDAQWDHGSSDGEIFSIISNGAGPGSEMKGKRGELSATDIWKIVSYIRTLGPQS